MGRRTHRAFTPKRFWVKSRTCQNRVDGAFENECPALAGGRERLAESHAGEGIWAAGKERLPLLVMLACGLGLRGSQASLGLTSAAGLPPDALANRLPQGEVSCP